MGEIILIQFIGTQDLIMHQKFNHKHPLIIDKKIYSHYYVMCPSPVCIKDKGPRL